MARNNRRNNRNNDNRNNGTRKHSGSKHGIDKNGAPYTTGWMYRYNAGLIKFLAVPYSKTAVHESSKGREWLNVMVKVQKPYSKPEIVSGLMDRQTGQVIMNDLGLVMNPKANNGGYCGPYGG